MLEASQVGVLDAPLQTALAASILLPLHEIGNPVCAGHLLPVCQHAMQVQGLGAFAQAVKLLLHPVSPRSADRSYRAGALAPSRRVSARAWTAWLPRAAGGAVPRGGA